ncbi:MAG: molybdopterin-synthase adenylyltransferase MoeB [Gemmatimonadota bacterium]|nr:molybdopterin-synthase adenylyltransferase MoeB [Gemmatimonadota bacterium]
MTRPETDLSTFSADELRRYGRQLALPAFGIEGQRGLKAASVLIVGAGGLGSPAALYLAAAGVGRLGIVEFDRVEQSNLHRQLLYASSDTGRSKIEAARERILGVNPEITVEGYETRLTSVNALSILKGFDIVLDGSDNFPTRYLVNDAAVIAGIPCVYGSVHRFEGQLSVFAARGGPCYRCLFREPPPAGAVPNCAEAGVLGVLPGIIGTLQATEAIKLIADIGEPLVGRLLLFDALAMSFRTVELRRDPDCPSCGASARGTLVDYDLECDANAVRSIAPLELAARLDRGDDVDIVDVREPYEWEIARLDGARLVPLGQLELEMESFDPARDTVVYCKTGKRSEQAAQILAGAGIRNVFSLDGGVVRWRGEVDPTFPQY